MKRLAWTAIIALGISASAYAQQQPATQAYGNLPMNFEQNVGQTDSQAQFISRGKGYTLFLSPNQAILRFHTVSFPVMNRSDQEKLGKRFLLERAKKATRKTAVVRMKLLGVNPGAQLVGVNKMPGTANYLIGNDPSKWHAGVPLFAKVQSSEVFPGIDLVYYGNEKRLEYDFVVKPGADLNAISLGFEGTQGTSIDSSGNLSMTTEIGGMKLNKPVVYQMIGGQRKEIGGKYARRGANAVGFDVTGYDKTQPLVIDPVLTYSTLLGGSADDGIYDIAVDSTGNAYVVGWTDSTDFPIVGTSLTPAPSGTQVAFVAKFNSTGTALTYSTYLGGNGGEWGSGIALDANGSAYVVGQTGSSNFPVTSNAYQTSFGSGASQNAFVSKLSADGQSLLYSTYLGGGGYDQGIGIALDANKNAYVTGYTTSGSPNPFPTTANAFQSTLNSVYGNGFISRIDTTKSGSSSLVYSTFLGGSGNWDQTNGIAVDAQQNVYVGGMTSSSDFPLTPTAYQTAVDTYNGTGFLTQIDTTKSGSAGLIYSTVIEGVTYGAGVALDAYGKVYVTGGYVAKFDTTKSGSASLLYFTRVGGSSDAFTYSVSVDPNGDSYVSGWTWSTDLTVTPDAIQSTLGSGGQNAFITALRPDGSAVLFGTYLGGNGGVDDFASSVAVDQNYNMYVAGATQSSNFQTTSGAFQTSLDGTSDAFVMKFSPLNVPIITSISPATGVTGATVTINGENFGSSQGNSTVAFANGVTAQITNWTATSINVNVPSGATTGNVVVTVSGNPSNGLGFSVVPNITNLSPLSGFAGTPVTITGTGFGATQGLSIVTFNGTQATPISWSNTSILVPVPSGTSSGNVVVTVSGAASNGLYFAVTVPTINSLSPTSGPTGTSVTISGSNFGATQGSSTVTFSGTPGTPTSWSSTSIVVPVPAAANTGNVVVTVGVVSSNAVSFSVVPNITSLSPLSGLPGVPITITGTGFGATQGSSTVTFSGTSATPISWSNTSIVAPVPSGATKGNVVVTVAGLSSIGANFTVLPTGWLDQDVGIAGLAGSATYSNGTFTVEGSGYQTYNSSADSLNFAYQSLSGDGSIVARVVSATSVQDAGVMIRETLNSNSTNAFMTYQNAPLLVFQYRTSTGGSTNYVEANGNVPYWVKVVRAGSTFSGYMSHDGVNWAQTGTSQTISMATSVYIGLAVNSGGTSTLGTATFDNVSVNSTATPAPVITTVSATTGPVGSQVTISGTGFGATQLDSVVMLNGAPTTISTWSSTSIAITIPTGATSGPLAVLVGPSMNASNPVMFTVTSQPLPSGWLDQDVGAVGTPGSATYSNGTFTLNGSGTMQTTTDAFHFVYQPLSGDGTIIARVVSTSASGQPGLMIRETLAANSTYASEIYYAYYFYLYDRPTTGGNATNQESVFDSPPPYWLKLSRSGSTFTGYFSPNGVSWTQIGTSVTISMAQNVYIGMIVDGGTNLQGTFDNVSVNSTAHPAPAITNLSATTGTIGSQVVITGSNFGDSQGSSLVLLNGVAMTVTSWSATSISVTIASGASSGYMAVALGPSMNSSNAVTFTVTTQPLPSGWLDQDVGSVGTAGNAGYSSGTFTINGSGDMGLTADAFHFVYQPLSGDGTIIARVVSANQSSTLPGVMIRETLAANSTYASVMYSNYLSIFFLYDRTTTGGNMTNQSTGYDSTLPYWVKLSRSGNTFAGYISPDGVYWTQVGTSFTISMAQNVYIGMNVDGGTNLQGTFDNVSITAGTPYLTPNITGISPGSGGIGASVTITGSNFGATQGSSSVLFNGSPATSITSWSSTQIVALVPSSASTGPLTVVVNGIGSNKNFVFAFYNPVISSLNPPFGPIGGTITISGSGFGANSTGSSVTSNGVTANFNTLTWSNTSITAIVPSNATSGPLTVTVGGVTSNSVQFTVIEAATVTGLSPASGPFGSSVVITGTGFGPTQSDSVLSFYGGQATSISSWSDTSITAVVPTSAASGPVSVIVAGNTAAGPVFTLTASVTLTDSLGHMTTYASENTAGQWLSTVSQGPGCSSCSSRGNIVNTYDPYGNILTTTDPMSITTTYTYDSANDMLSQSTPLNSSTNATTSYTYNSFGEVLTVTDPLGNVTTNAYDSHGNLTSVTSPAPNSGTAASVTTFAYNSLGELTTITDPLGHVTTMTYTSAGLIATITDAQGNVTTYGYDAKGNRTSVTDALSHTTTFTYDAMSRLTTITYPDSTTSSFTYDYRGRRTSVTDQNGMTTSYAYDDADRLTSVTDAASHVTNYAYDTEDNLTSITDANSNQTAFTYDAFGRVTQTNFPSSLSEYYQYDADNNLTQKTDRKGQTITYLYDALNRLTSKTYPDTTNVEYAYDLVGKILQVNDPTGTYAFTYDNMGRLIGTTTSYSFLTSRNFTNAYTYDSASNRTGFTDPEGGSTAYSYDTLNRLTSLAPPSAFGSGSFGFTYDALSRRTQMTRPNSVTTNYTYDNLSRLLSVLHQLSGSTIDGASYTLDSAGNRTAKTDQRAAVTSNYTYDPIYQLTQVTQANNTTESYSYDAVGNRTASLGVSSYTTNASNELTATSNASYTYDSNGNTLTKVVGSNTTSYTWDFENRLASVTLPNSGGTVSFKHDPYGRRIYKSSSAGTSVFAYDGANLIEETNSSGVVVARYAQASKIDEPLAMLRSSATSYYEADGLGSITSLTNGAGALAQTYTVDSFGKQTASSGSLVNSFQYTGRELDPETGLYYYRARYYDPASGRFLSEDPLRFGADADFYPYVGNSPLNFGDPLGLCPPEDPCWIPKYPPGQNPDTNIDLAVRGGPLFWFLEQDWTGAPWDYKTTVGGQFDDAGNFNFGATGAALGFPDSMLLHGADLFKKFRNLKKFKPPNPNEPDKNRMIQRGIDYFKHGCSPPIELIEPPFLQ